MTHVFVVNDQTFRFHLEYMFAGTCASTDAVFFDDVNYHNPQKKSDGLTPRQELTIAGMIADVSRIREGDRILFYLTQSKQHDGLFFGVFRVSELPFYDSNKENYLSGNLGVKLNFRVCIKPDRVFQYGITERDALDSLEGITHPSQMCWSMIYRKLKGKRGCTMVTEYESDRLIRLISNHNNNTVLPKNGYTFNAAESRIEVNKTPICIEGPKKV